MTFTESIKVALECSCDSMEEIEEGANPAERLENELATVDAIDTLNELSVEGRNDLIQLERSFEHIVSLGGIYHTAETASTESTSAADVEMLNLALQARYAQLGLSGGAYLVHEGNGITDASMEGVFDFIGKIIKGIGTAWDGFIERMKISHQSHSNGTTAIQRRIVALNNYLNKTAAFDAPAGELKLSARRVQYLTTVRGKSLPKDLPAELERLTKLRDTVVRQISSEVATYSDKIYDGLPRCVINPTTFESELKKLLGRAPDIASLWKHLDDGKGNYLGQVQAVKADEYKPSAHVPTWFSDFQRYVEYTPYYLNHENRSAGTIDVVPGVSSEQLKKELVAVEATIDKMLKANDSFQNTWSRNYQKWKTCRDKLWRTLEQIGDDYSRAQVTLMRIALLSGEYNFARTSAETDMIGSMYIMATDAVVARAEQSFINRTK